MDIQTNHTLKKNINLIFFETLYVSAFLTDTRIEKFTFKEIETNLILNL